MLNKLPSVASQALQDARKNYIESENSNRIKRALLHKTRTCLYESFEPRDRVYFKRNGHRGWVGPAVVIGADKYTVVVKL